MGLPRYCKLLLALSLVAQALPQEIDTAIFVEGRKPFTILDQIENPKERQAFLTLYRQSDAEKRRQLAELFLVNYPRSWLLAPVYEIAAKA